MPVQVTYVSSSGDETTFQGDAGDSVMEIAVRNGVREIVAECGGSLSCSTCHVFVRPEDLSELPVVGELEDEMLDTTAVDRQDNSRLSCQLTLHEGAQICVTTPDEQV